MSASDAITAVKVVGQAAGLVIGVLSWNKARVEDKKRMWTDVYRALSRHPILKYIYPNHPDPSSKWDSLDFYRQLVTQSKKHEVFTEASKLGETGAKAKVVLVLLWIIVQHLPPGMEAESVISRAITIEADTYGEPLAVAAHLSDVIGQLAKLFKMPLPSEILKSLNRLTPPRGDDNSRFYVDFLKGFHKMTLPSGCHHNEYDLSKKPHALLEAHNGFVMAPKNEPTERVMAWCIRRLHLGKHFKASSSRKSSDGAAWLAILPRKLMYVFKLNAMLIALLLYYFTEIKKPKTRKPSGRTSNKSPARATLRKPRRKSTGPGLAQVAYRVRGRIPTRSQLTSKELPTLVPTSTGSIPVLQSAPSASSERLPPTVELVNDNLPSEMDMMTPGEASVPDLRQLLERDLVSESLDDRLAVAHSFLSFHPAMDNTLLRIPSWTSSILPLFGITCKVSEDTASHRRLKTVIALLWTVGIFLSEDQLVSLLSSVFEDCTRRIQKFLVKSRDLDSGSDSHSGSESAAESFEALLSLEEVIKDFAIIISNSRHNASLIAEDLEDGSHLPVDVERFLKAYGDSIVVDDASSGTGRNEDTDLRLRQAILSTFGGQWEPNEEEVYEDDEEEEEGGPFNLELSEGIHSDQEVHRINVDIQTNPISLFRTQSVRSVFIPSNSITRSVIKSLVDDFCLGIHADGLIDSSVKATHIWIADLEGSCSS